MRIIDMTDAQLRDLICSAIAAGVERALKIIDDRNRQPPPENVFTMPRRSGGLSGR